VLADARLSAAIVAGTFRQDDDSDFRDLPAVRNNISTLARTLRDPKVWGLPAGQCHERPQPRRDELLELVADAAATAEDTLVIYFAGHGFIHPRTEDLYLALPGARRDRGYGTRAIRFTDLQAALQEPAVVVRHKVIILDCCFAGAALGDAMGDDDIDQKLRTRGTCLLVSSDADRTSKAPRGAEFTAYTRQLITTLERGVATAGELLTLQEIHEDVEGALVGAGLPRPRLLGVDAGGGIRIARNRSWKPTRAQPPVPVAVPARADTRFHDELLRILSEALTPGPRVQLGHSISWKHLPDHEPRPDERLLAVIDESWLRNRAEFLAFTSRAVIVRYKDLLGSRTTVLPYSDLRRAAVRFHDRNVVGQAALAFLQTAGSKRPSRPDRANRLEIVIDGERHRVPDGQFGIRASGALLAAVRDAAVAHGHG
jgi:hypothetical protein